MMIVITKEVVSVRVRGLPSSASVRGLLPDVPHTEKLKDEPMTLTEITPFVITYNPAVPNAHIIHKHSYILYPLDRCRNIFKNLPLVAYRRCNNISDIFVRAQFPETRDHSNFRATPGSLRCNSRKCTTCPYIEHGRNQYTFLFYW